MAKHQNEPGGPTNLPQHGTGEAGGHPKPTHYKHRQTGIGTAAKNDVADPHPEDEEHYGRERRPGGANPPEKDRSTSVGLHTGEAPPPPRNATNTRR